MAESMALAIPNEAMVASCSTIIPTAFRRQSMDEVLPIHTRRLILRRFEQSDCDCFVAYRSDPEIARYQSWSQYTYEDADRFFREQASVQMGQVGKWLQIACVETASAQLVGDCALHFLDDAVSIELGFTIARGHQGKGFGQEALQALISYIFGSAGYQKIQAVTDARNLRSIRLLEKLGFQRLQANPSPAFFKGEYCQEWTYILERSPGGFDWAVAESSESSRK
jgi:RimJ/RimL family protein N-acetyltransferase